jgi:hypothetical protein
MKKSSVVKSHSHPKVFQNDSKMAVKPYKQVSTWVLPRK